MQGRIFLAGPLFSEAERSFNLSVATHLRKKGLEVWLPQEAGYLKHGTPAEKKNIFEEDLRALRESTAILAILDGNDVDAGTAFELGYAYALKKPLYGLKTDYRSFSPIESVNLMLEVPLRQIFRSVDEAAATLKSEPL